MPPPRLLVLFNQPTLPAEHPDAESEHEILYTADVVAKVLHDAGAIVRRHGIVDDPQSVLDGVRSFAPDAIFNLYEGPAGWGNAESLVAGVLELLRIPFTGSPALALAMARNKPLTKSLLNGVGLPTAPGYLVDALPGPENPLDWPVIVKPAAQDASIGISQESVVANSHDLSERVRHVWQHYGGPVLVERFILGREFNVPVWDRGEGPRTLPYSEILFPDTSAHPILSFNAKWSPASPEFQQTPAVPAQNLSEELRTAVDATAIACFRLLGCRDYARVDYRIDSANQAYILEVNPNPSISPGAGFAEGLAWAHLTYEEFIVEVARAALRRGPQPELAEGLTIPVGLVTPSGGV